MVETVTSTAAAARLSTTVVVVQAVLASGVAEADTVHVHREDGGEEESLLSKGKRDVEVVVVRSVTLKASDVGLAIHACRKKSERSPMTARRQNSWMEASTKTPAKKPKVRQVISANKLRVMLQPSLLSPCATLILTSRCGGVPTTLLVTAMAFSRLMKVTR